MAKIPGISNIIPVRGVVMNAPKTEKIKIGKSGLPVEMPLDTFHKEQEVINLLNPATPYENALREIQNKLAQFEKLK